MNISGILAVLAWAACAVAELLAGPRDTNLEPRAKTKAFPEPKYFRAFPPLSTPRVGHISMHPPIAKPNVQPADLS